MKLNRHNILYTAAAGLLGLLSLASCKKTVEYVPGNGEEAYVNFYNASEVLLQNITYSQNNQIIINDTLQGKAQPQFYSGGDFRQYPRTSVNRDGSGQEGPYPPLGTTYDAVYWLPVTAGNYRFIYTSLKSVYLKDTSIKVDPKTFNTQYLVESPMADTAYRIITVPEVRQGSAGKVRIRVINLSPDFGQLEVYRADKDGNRMPESLPSALAYGNYSDYAELDTAGASKTRGQLLLKFVKKGSDAAVVTRAIDAIAYSSFTLVFQGFENQTSRGIKTGNNIYQPVTVNPNLRVSVRRFF